MRRWLTGAAVLAAGATLGFGGVAAASGPVPAHSGDDATSTSSTSPDTTTAPVVAAQDSVTLPLFGASITVEVSTDPSGQIAAVALDPADGYTAVVDRPHKVAFVNEDGTAKVRVDARHGGQSVSAKGTTLADISGDGSWSGDPLGTGTTATVTFRVQAAADGGPDIVDVASSDATATVGATQHHSGRSISMARASVTFSSGGQQRTLWITATVSRFDDTSRAAVGVTLSSVRGVAQDPAAAAGAKTWSGMLCDGSTGSIAYTVGTDGTISAVTATPADATVNTSDKSADVRFSTGERVRISVRTNDDGQIKVSIDQRFRCDVTDPSVNTPTSTQPDDHGDHGDHGGGKGPWPGTGDDHHQQSTTSTDASTPTTAATTPTSVRDDATRPTTTSDDHRGQGGGSSGGGRGGTGGHG